MQTRLRYFLRAWPTAVMLACTGMGYAMLKPSAPVRLPLRSLQKVFDGLVATNQGYGGAAVQVSQAALPLFSAVAGRLGGAQTAPMALDSAFEIASISKLFTAVIVLQLHEAGMLQLDEPAARYLPKDFMKDFLVSDGTDHSGAITVAHLLRHRSGLANFWEDPPLDKVGNNKFIEAFLTEPQRLWLPVEVLATLPSLQPYALPGQRWHYADSNYVLLGCIIEHLTQQPLHTVLRTRLLKPWALRDTYLRYHEPQPQLHPRPLAHRFEGPLDLDNEQRQSADWASGGLVSSVADLRVFLNALFAGQMFDDPQTLKRMLDCSPTDMPGVGYGLGVFCINLPEPLGTLYGHDGHGNSFAYLWPKRQVTFVGSFNQLNNDWWPLVQATTEALR